MSKKKATKKASKVIKKAKTVTKAYKNFSDWFTVIR
jgi:hypothetical protein